MENYISSDNINNKKYPIVSLDCIILLKKYYLFII